MKNQKLSTKLSLIYAGLFSAIFLVLSIGILICTYQILLHDRSDYLRYYMPTMKEHILREQAEAHELDDAEILAEKASDTNVNIVLYSPEGIPLNETQNYEMNASQIPEDLDVVRMTRQDGMFLLSLSSEVTDANGDVGTLLLVYNLKAEIGYIRSLSLLLLAANLIGVIAATFVGRFISRKMLSPIDGIIRETQNITSKNLKLRLPVPEAEDELRMLALTINKMLSRVEDAFAQQSRFAADASHELRTPLAVISGHTEMLMRWGSENKEALDLGLQTVAKQTRYMNKLVENLLFLSRGESEKLEANKTVFPVRALLDEVVQEQRLLDAKHQYEVNGSETAQLIADRNMIRQLLIALVDNSKKFTPEGGSVTLSVADRGREIELSVADTGVGMEKEHVEHIFERFYRVDKSRSRTEGGSGLGLSIVKSIAEIHGATVVAESVPGEGTRISIRFLPME